MVSFESDYICGAHPAILQRLAETNTEPLPGYGTDKYSESAKQKITDALGCDTAEIEFLTGGTQTNATVISALLKDHEGVIAADTGHISLHEAGAVEYTGHKVITVPQENGKIKFSALEQYLRAFYADDNREHMVFPGMVYISHPTEYGTLYTKAELTSLAALCRQYQMTLFLDGARLGYGLMSKETDVTLSDIAALTDVFTIGGTKVGALCGEAVVFTRNNKPPHFMNAVKKRGALLAKGRLTGIQFDTLFTDGLYFKISAHAIEMAEKLKALLSAKGLPFFIASPTNQQFVIVEDTALAKLKEQVAVSFWEKPDPAHTVIRLAASWSTTDEDLAALEAALNAIF